MPCIGEFYRVRISRDLFDNIPRDNVHNVQDKFCTWVSEQTFHGNWRWTFFPFFLCYRYNALAWRIRRGVFANVCTRIANRVDFRSRHAGVPVEVREHAAVLTVSRGASRYRAHASPFCTYIALECRRWRMPSRTRCTPRLYSWCKCCFSRRRCLMHLLRRSRMRRETIAPAVCIFRRSISTIYAVVWNTGFISGVIATCYSFIRAESYSRIKCSQIN